MVVSFNWVAAAQLLSLPDLSVFLNFKSSGKSCRSCVVSWDLGRFTTWSSETPSLTARCSVVFIRQGTSLQMRNSDSLLSDINYSVHIWTPCLLCRFHLLKSRFCVLLGRMRLCLFMRYNCSNSRHTVRFPKTPKLSRNLNFFSLVGP